jgi:hypothetical protein
MRQSEVYEHLKFLLDTKNNESDRFTHALRLIAHYRYIEAKFASNLNKIHELSDLSTFE